VGEALGAPDQLRREARMTGVELRHPLRDPELVDLALRLPPELAYHSRVDRPLARRALAGELPPETLRSDRKPVFNSLLESALQGPDRALVDQLLGDPHPELARLVRGTALDRMRRLGGGTPPVAWALDLWRISQLEMWLRERENPGGDWGWAAAGDASGGILFTVIRGHLRQT
jgi:asparagine synthetase B (glutamine-hydrolysing)